MIYISRTPHLCQNADALAKKRSNPLKSYSHAAGEASNHIYIDKASLGKQNLVPLWEWSNIHIQGSNKAAQRRMEINFHFERVIFSQTIEIPSLRGLYQIS